MPDPLPVAGLAWTFHLPSMDLAWSWDVPAVDPALSAAAACRDCGWAQVVNEDLYEGREDRVPAWHAALPDQGSGRLAEGSAQAGLQSGQGGALRAALRAAVYLVFRWGLQ